MSVSQEGSAVQVVGGASRRADPSRAELLRSGSAREVLARIVPGDPLRLRPLVARRLRELALLFDADRVHLCALARAAREAPAWRGRPPLDAFLAERVDEAIEDLLDAVSTGGASDEREDDAFRLLGAPLGLDPDAARAACAKFDRLPLPAREAFFRLVLEGRSLEEVSAELAASATEVARGARRALDVLLASAPPLPTERPAT